MNNVQLYEMLKKASKKSKRGKYQIVLHDDNHNTFDNVINCLIDACGHNEFQAHQCALIVHKTGKCIVLIDSHSVCEIAYEFLLKVGLKVTLEKHVKQNP